MRHRGCFCGVCCAALQGEHIVANTGIEARATILNQPTSVPVWKILESCTTSTTTPIHSSVKKKQTTATWQKYGNHGNSCFLTKQQPTINIIISITQIVLTIDVAVSLSLVVVSLLKGTIWLDMVVYPTMVTAILVQQRANFDQKHSLL
jgi:hypothetical protein